METWVGQVIGVSKLTAHKKRKIYHTEFQTIYVDIFPTLPLNVDGI